MQPIDNMNKNSVITWYHWETIEIKKDDKLKHCVSCVPKETTFQTVLDALEQDMKTYPGHAFRAAWQQQKTDGNLYRQVISRICCRGDGFQ